MYTKTLQISIVSLLACFIGQTVFASNTHTTTAKHNGTVTKAAVIKKNKHKQKLHHAPAKKPVKIVKTTHEKPAVAPTENIVPVAAVVASDLQEFKLQPRFNGWGYSGERTLIEGQFLAPFYGNSQKALFGIFEADRVKNGDTWLAGAGLGYRQVVEEKIFGAYAKLDYNNSEENNGFWIVNPGLEMLGQVWDLNINGYIPVGLKKSLAIEGWADEFGNFSFAKFTGHKEFNHRLKLYEESRLGVNAEIGRVVPCIDAARIYVGAYHFDTDDAGSTNGVSAKLTYELNKYAGGGMFDWIHEST